MRALFVSGFVSTLALAACGGGNNMMGGDDDDMPPADGDITPPPARGFRITSPDIDIQPGQEITYCYYFRTPNTESLGIKRWTSTMTPGSHHMIMFTTGNTDEMPPGTISASNCGGVGGSGLNVPIWTYAAQTPTADLQMPTDDGAGKPLGMDIAPNTAAYFQMHYLNATDNVIKAHVQLDAEAYDAGTAYTKTAAYVTFNGNLSIPPMAQNFQQPPETMQQGGLPSATCATPAGAKFWLMSTHAHKQAVHTEVRDGEMGPVVFSSDDWEHPGARMDTGPFYQFASNKLTYVCTYTNLGDNKDFTIHTGNSAATNEMCMASGYYFPATKPVFCFNSVVAPF